MSLLRGVVSRRRSGPRGNLVGAAEAAPTGSFTPGSTAPAQQAAADLHQVAEAQLSIAVLVEHRAEQAAAEAALLADVLLFLAEDAAEGVGIRARRRSEEHTSTPVTNAHPVCRLLLEKKNHPNKKTN